MAGIVLTPPSGYIAGGAGGSIPDPPADRRYVLGNDGAGSIEWVRQSLDDLQAAFAVTIAVANGAGTLVEVGSAWAPTFNRTFTPDSVGLSAETFSDSLGGSVSRLGSSNPVAGPSASYTRTTVNQVVSVTDTAVRSGVTDASNVISCTWGCSVWTGVKTIPGAYNASFIATLTKSSTKTSRAGTYSYTSDANSGKRGYFVVSQVHAAIGSTLTASKFVINGGLAGGFTQVATGVNVTLGSATVACDIWESNQDFPLTGSPHSVVVS